LLYTNYCAICHGPGGKGDGVIAQRSVLKPRSLLEGNALQMKDGQMFHVLTYGQGSMASYAAMLPPEDRWRVVLHVRTLQKQATGKGTP
jgi:mono/diheme cytochrome c family protein